MYSNVIRTFAFATCTIAAVSIAGAQQNSFVRQGVDIGKWEYEGHCAVCHGVTGKGDGYFYKERADKSAASLNLADLSKKNNGTFPFARVYEIIDGRQVIQAHGTRQMPIWGRDFSAMSATQDLHYDHDVFARAKILALTEYIYRLQAK